LLASFSRFDPLMQKILRRLYRKTDGEGIRAVQEQRAVGP
jgi:hypothetical protein